MGECVNLRCAQEKRHFRKELISWYKKVPYAIDMETDTAVDFIPPSESVCIHCEGKDPVTTELLEQENIPMASIQTSEQATPKTHLQAAATCNGNDSSYSAAATGGVTDIPILEGLNSFYNQLAMTSLLYQQQHLQTAAVQAALTSGSSQSTRRPSHTTSSLGLHSPDLGLDLRSTSSAFGVSNTQIPTSESGSLKVPEIRTKKKKDNSPKRAYTDRELNAAVEAIKSGEVGTRRAAQMYGVPRSTLRNKVFKSSEMSRQLPDAHGHFSGSATLEGVCNSPTPPKSDSESQSPISSNKHISPRGKTSDDHPSDNMTQYHGALLKQLEELKTKQGIHDQLSMMSHQNRLLGEMFNPLQFAASYPFFMPQYSALAGMPSLDYMNPYTSSMMMPSYLPELVKNLAQKQLETERAGYLPSSSNRHNSSTRGKSDQGSSSKMVVAKERDDIKVPAYRPSTAASHIGNGHLPTAIKEEKDRSEKSLELPGKFSATNYLQSMISQSPSTSKRTSPQISHTPSKKSFNEQSLNNSVSSQHTHSSLLNGNSSGKKRPKRGQYRKYDSELLAQAVKSVQRGEMSVHRAGTYYGVPHSTLEYKVKERHLLRKKKIAENSENKANLTLDAVSVSKPSATNIGSNISPDSSQSEYKTSPTSPTLAIDDSKPSAATAATDSNPPNFLDFSSSYNLNAPASELLMKLHARAQQKANEIINGKKSQENKGNKESPQQFSLEKVSN